MEQLDAQSQQAWQPTQYIHNITNVCLLVFLHECGKPKQMHLQMQTGCGKQCRSIPIVDLDCGNMNSPGSTPHLEHTRWSKSSLALFALSSVFLQRPCFALFRTRAGLGSFEMVFGTACRRSKLLNTHIQHP